MAKAVTENPEKKEKSSQSTVKSPSEKSSTGSQSNPRTTLKTTVRESPESTLHETRVDSGREWRCLTCNATAPSTTSGHMSLIKHKCSGEKEIRLIALETGEELAASFREALNAGLLGKLKEERGPGEKQDSSRGAPQVTGDNNIRITITLPAIDVALFNIARRTSESG